MDTSRARELAEEVFGCRAAGDLQAGRDAASAYRTLLAGSEPTELAALTADVEGIDLELAAEQVGERAVAQADDLFLCYAQRTEPELPATAAFALRIKVALLVNAHRGTEAVLAAEQLQRFFADRVDAGRQDVITGYVVDVADMMMSVGAFDSAIALLSAADDRLREVDTGAAQSIWARAQMLRVVAILHSGDTERLPPVMHDLHAAGQAALTAIDELLLRWANKPSWTGARISALGNKAVLLSSMGQDDQVAPTRAALEAELRQISAALDVEAEPSADKVINEIRDALLS